MLRFWSNAKVKCYKLEYQFRVVLLFIYVNFSFSVVKKAAKELLYSLMDLLESIMTLWFTIHCNALQQHYYICICCVSMKTENHMFPMKQHVQTRATSTRSWRKSDAGSEERCREGWRETNRKGQTEKTRRVKINRDSGWGVLSDVERWSWGERKKGRPYRVKVNMQLNWYNLRP